MLSCLQYSTKMICTMNDISYDNNSLLNGIAGHYLKNVEGMAYYVNLNSRWMNMSHNRNNELYRIKLIMQYIDKLNIHPYNNSVPCITEHTECDNY